MSFLTKKLPTAVRIGEEVHPINTDFRTALRIMTAFECPQLTSSEKQIIMLTNLYQGKIPEDLETACRQAVKFLNGGEETAESEEEPTENNLGRLYSFSKDAKFIFAAISQTHGVDVDSIPHLHWWKFMAYFLDLSESCFFSRLVYLRRQKRTGKWSKEEREWYYSIQDIADLPEDAIHDENLDEFMELLEGGALSKI